MGDVADMMLDGTLCERCGVVLDETGEGVGHPLLCASCLYDSCQGVTPPGREEPRRNPYRCPLCGRKARHWFGVLVHLVDSSYHENARKNEPERWADAVLAVARNVREDTTKEATP